MFHPGTAILQRETANDLVRQYRDRAFIDIQSGQGLPVQYDYSESGVFMPPVQKVIIPTGPV